MYNSNSENTEIATLYAPGFSYLRMSYFRTYLTLDFAQWLNRDNTGKDYYCKKTRESTTVNHVGAKGFYQLAKSIIDGSGAGKQVDIVLSCKRGADLIFEYKPESDGQMMAYLTINKDNLPIRLWFPLNQYDEINENGQKVTKVIQRGLGTFAKTMYGYLTRMDANQNLDKLPEGFNEYRDYNQQVFS